MHPAYSIIFFTTASGAGYGLLFALGLFAAFSMLPAGTAFGLGAFGLAFVLVSTGLASSAVHLGRPERAMRALTQWRSSWLSREGVAALAAYPIAGIFALLWLVSGPGPWTTLFALASMAMSVVTVACTGMIYASLKPVRRWNNAWVTPNYLALALMTGALWLAAVAALAGLDATVFSILSIASLIVAGALKLAYWRHIDADTGGPTPESATGLGDLGKVRLLDAPHTSENFLLKEMGYRIARKHARRLRRVALALGFALPLVLVILVLGKAGAATTVTTLLAALSASVGVLIERWLFFAEARHSVILYYGRRAA
ncbi:MAG: dimethyl sulfoxide reductase anchor subunit family protein [Alphaproteobacteria bacterium]